MSRVPAFSSSTRRSKTGNESEADKRRQHFGIVYATLESCRGHRRHFGVTRTELLDCRTKTRPSGRRPNRCLGDSRFSRGEITGRAAAQRANRRLRRLVVNIGARDSAGDRDEKRLVRTPCIDRHPSGRPQSHAPARAAAAVRATRVDGPHAAGLELGAAGAVLREASARLPPRYLSKDPRAPALTGVTTSKPMKALAFVVRCSTRLYPSPSIRALSSAPSPFRPRSVPEPRRGAGGAPAPRR